MQLHFVGKNIEVTQALKDFTTEKFDHLEKRFSHITKINVTFSVEHIAQIAEATIVFTGHEIHASAQADDMYVAIDALIDKLAGQITKHKEKIIDSHR